VSVCTVVLKVIEFGINCFVKKPLSCSTFLLEAIHYLAVNSVEETWHRWEESWSKSSKVVKEFKRVSRVESELDSKLNASEE